MPKKITPIKPKNSVETDSATVVSPRKTRTGRVDRISGINTARIVMYDSMIHPIYKKRFTRTYHLLVDTKEVPVNVGDTVLALEVKPISRHKTWKVTKVISKGIAHSESEEGNE